MHQLLIIDDEQHVVDRLAETLPWDTMGISEVHKAYSAAEALEILCGEQIDVVITDIQMPEMDGLEMINLIRQRSKRMKFVLLSGHAEFSYAREGIKQEIFRYLLKPVTDEELLETVRQAIQRIQTEWEELVSKQKSERTLRAHLPLLRANMLNELLNNRNKSEQSLRDNLELLDIPAAIHQPFSLAVIRMEKTYEIPSRDDSLMEYAISNIAEELLGEEYAIWSCKDSHDYLVMMLQPKHGECDLSKLENSTIRLQSAVEHFLGKTISVILGESGIFPQDLTELYRQAVSAMRRKIGKETGLFVRVSRDTFPARISPLRSLSEPPVLTHLMEAGRFEEAEQKLLAAFEELQQQSEYLYEYLLEAGYSCAGSFALIAHHHGITLEELLGDGHDQLISGTVFESARKLKEWALRTIGKLRTLTEEETNDTRSSVVKLAQAYIEQHLADDVSLTSIAEHVYLHPAYLSKIYKLGTGETISEYVNRLRMERAVFLLKDRRMKVYEIADAVGYQHAHSFIYAFKKYYGVTPMEYRVE